MTSTNKITVFEHETLTLKHIGFRQKHLGSLQAFHGEKGVPYYSLIHKGVKFNQFVGVLQLGDLSIEILPKADKAKGENYWRSLLIDMLRMVGEFKVDAPSESQLALKSDSVLDLYFSLFIQELEYIQHQGWIKKYRKNEGNVKSLKGSLNFTKHLNENLIHKERFYTAHTVYDQNHILHAILHRALLVLKRMNTNLLLISRIENLLLNFPEQSSVKITSATFRKFHFDRKTDVYKKAFHIAELILLNYHPDLSSGNNNVLALLFDMNNLWEKYVYVGLRKYLPHGMTITPQNSKHFWKATAGQNSTMRPDIVINKGKLDCIVLDTKWKNIASTNPSPQDLRQMYVYSKFYQASKVALIYPGEITEERGGKYFQESKAELGNQECSIITLQPEKRIENWAHKVLMYMSEERFVVGENL